MVRTIVGTRIRERRRQIGLTQAELARRAGISASYLNLIEANKRRIAGALLNTVAEHLGLPADGLDGAAELRLADSLNEIAHRGALTSLHVEADRADELIGRFPGWARALAALDKSERDASQTARILADRLTHDPFLGESVHRMLSRISAIRSAAEILSEFGDVTPDEQARFHAIIRDESRTLTDVGEALAGYFERTTETEGSLTPLDEVEALFDAYDNHFAPVEDAAGKLAQKVSAITTPDKALQLVDTHLITEINAFLEQQTQTETATARARARRALAKYAAHALLAPIEIVSDAALRHRFDAELIARDLGLEPETVLYRLACLPKRDGWPRFGYFCANAAGTTIETLGLPGLTAPRYAAACPLWSLYRAQQMPERFLDQLAIFPSGAKFMLLARARMAGPLGFGAPRHFLTDMLTISADDAALTVYAPAPGAPVEEIGIACRLCPRETCAHRVDDPLAE